MYRSRCLLVIQRSQRRLHSNEFSNSVEGKRGLFGGYDGECYRVMCREAVLCVCVLVGGVDRVGSVQEKGGQGDHLTRVPG